MHRFLNIMLYAALLAGFLLYGWEELTLAAKKLVFWALTALPQLRRLPARVATWRESRRSLKVKVRILNEGKKENFISAAYTGMKRTLNTTGSQDKVRLIRLVSLCTGSAGAALAFSLGSWMLVPILSIGMGLLPMWLTRFRQYSYHLEITGELSVALSMVTNSYIRTENILLAVEENLPYLHGQVRHTFRQFLRNSRDVDPNIKRNLSKMSRQNDNHVFLLWCQLLIMCQEDINQKHSLNAVVSQLAQDKELYNTLSAEITQPLRTFAALLLLTMACFPTAVLVGKQLSGAMEPMEILFTTLLGQVIVVGYAVTALFGINRAIRLSTTIEEVPL